MCDHEADNSMKEMVFSYAMSPDDRTAYNALWILTHLKRDSLRWLHGKREELINALLHTIHVGRQRLLLSLLECALPDTEADIRADYLDFCLSKINSTAPYAIRALCIKQAFAQCRFFPELIRELSAEIEMMDYAGLSPGLRSVRKNILRKMSRL